MEIFFLGTNGWYETSMGSTTCSLVKTVNENIVLDAGSGFYRVEKLLDYSKPVYIFLSHLHIDHIEGLQILRKFDIASGIKILLGPDMKKELESFLRPPFAPPLSSLKTKIEIFEPPYDLPFNVETLPLAHAVPATAFRFSLEGKIVVYALDTGVSENLVKIAKNADLLITGAGFFPGHKPDNNLLMPEEGARAALDSGAKKLALIHFKADEYLTFQDRNEALISAQKIFKNVIAPKDGNSIVL
ncbi:MAG: ribonuclease Z [Endomicrobia bacterium]|nr:ribonuclease Z [Endomicrobiia bacterium]